MKYRYIILLALFFSSQSLISQGVSSRQIDSLVQTAMDKMPHAGISIAVIKDGEVVHSKGYGISSMKTGDLVNEHTRFAIASNSKAFTSAALAILVDEGKLSWEDKVVDHVPEFKMYNPYVTANFNIVDLLTHRSGMGLGAGDLMFFPDGANFTMKDVLSSFQHQKKVSEFRTKYDYDNLLYMVAGEVISRISGMSWYEFVEEKIMKPAGMNESAGVLSRLKNQSNVAKPHSVVDDKLQEVDEFDISIGAPAGGIYASVHDLCKWMQLHLDGGKIGEDEIFSNESQAMMWKPHTNMGFYFKANPPYNTHINSYGLGWGITDIKGHIVFSHTGGLPGMLSKTTIVPDLNLGIVVLTNAAPGGLSFESISRTISDSYMDIEGVDWITRIEGVLAMREKQGDEVTDAVWETVKNANSEHIKFEDYIGIYQDDWFGKMEVFEKEGSLWMKAHRSPKLTGQMSFYKANTFAIKWDYQDMNCDAFANFTLDTDGKAKSIEMKGISPNIDFSFDFHNLDLQRVELKN